MKTERLSISVTMESDWHVGSGTGRVGDVDRLVRRDADNLPYLPGKTLTGIWRDACELVARGLDDGQESGAWSEWVDYLFGDQPSQSSAARPVPPRQAALSVRSAYFPDTLRAALRKKPGLQDAMSLVKPGVSLDARTGRARDKHLRLEEMVRGGCVLRASAELTLPRDDDCARAALALLMAGAHMVDRIGGKRRRGAGRCRIEIKSDSEFDWLAVLEELQTPPAVPAREGVRSPQAIAYANSGGWVCLDVIVEARAPIVIPARRLGNVVESMDFIPGTYLVAIIARRLANLGVDATSAVGRGDLIVTNATPDGGRPVPFVLSKQKAGDQPLVYNRLCESSPSESLKSVREGYVLDSPPRLKGVGAMLNTHNTVTDASQRPEGAGVYSYQAIPTGTVLRGELRLRAGVAAALEAHRADWWRQLGGDHRVGLSKKDEYGLAHIAIRPRTEASVPPAQQADSESRLTVWLLSDVLLRDERHRPACRVSDLAKTLGNELGVSLRERTPDDGLLSAAVRTRRTDSWHVGWGLPRPSLVGLGAGSCVVFDVSGSLDLSKLLEIEMDGIGERRAEGYGQVRFNPPLLAGPTSLNRVASDEGGEGDGPAGDPVPKADAQSCEYARVIERAAWRAEIQRAALGLAATPDGRREVLGLEEGKPPNSQLAALRSALGRLQQSTDRERVIRWLEHLEKTPNRAGKWPEGALADNVKPLISDPNRAWEKLSESADFDSVTMTENGQQELQEELWAEAVRTLVAACVRAHKRSREEPADGEGE